MLKELKKAISIESKASMIIMSHKVEHNHEQIAIAKKKKKKTRKLGEELARRIQSKF